MATDPSSDPNAILPGGGMDYGAVRDPGKSLAAYPAPDQAIALSTPPVAPPLQLPPGPGAPALATTETPLSVTVGPSIQLSDGSIVELPPGQLDRGVWAKHVAKWEADLDKKYGAIAATQDAMHIPTYVDENGQKQEGTKAYSATRAYQNTPWGRTMARADHNLGGNVVHRQFLDPLIKATGGAPDVLAGAVLRGGPSVVTWPADLAATVANAGKHYIAPEMGTRYDIPSPSESVQHEMSIPALPEDAGPAHRIFDATVAGAMGSPASAATRELMAGGATIPKILASGAGDVARALPGAAAYSAAGQFGSDIGGQYGGEAGSLAGGLLAPGALNPIGRGAARGVASIARSEEAAQTAAAHLRLTGELPSSRSMMNPTFQRLNTFISSLPITGHAVLADNDRTTAALEQHAQRVAAEIAGQGNIPPGGATTESIGGTAMAGAQQASGGGPEALGTPGRPMPDIPGQIAQHWEPVHTLMQGGKADIRPMLTAIDQLYGRDPTFAPNEDAIRSMVAQLTSQAPGGAGRGPALANTPGGERFVGPVQPRDPNAPPGPVMVPWSALKDFRSTVGQQIGPDGVRVPEQHVPTLRDWATDAMRAAAEGEAPGRGASLLDTATRATAQLEPWQTKMEQMGGKPYGPAPRAFKPTPGGEQSAANAITSKLGAPSVTEPFTDPSRFPASYWRSIAGQILSRLGYKPEGDWTPEKFTRDYRKYGDQGMEQLTQSPAGHPTQHLQDIRDVAQVAGNATTTPSRHGLTASMGAGYAIHALLQHMGLLGAAVGGPVGASVAPLAAAYGMSRGMVSPAFKRALAGMSGSPNYSSELQGVGRSAASIADEDMYRRLKMSPAAPAAGYQ